MRFGYAAPSRIYGGEFVFWKKRKDMDTWVFDSSSLGVEMRVEHWRGCPGGIAPMGGVFLVCT